MSIPVLGSPTAETSGTTRAGVVDQRVASADGTTPTWYGGSAKSRLVPPPEPYRYVSDAHQPLADASRNPSQLRRLRVVPQPVSNWYAVGSAAVPSASVVPPTAVTHGLEAGQSAVALAAGPPSVSSPASPDEK